MPTRTWTTMYKNHRIEVESWWGVWLLFNRRRCRLYVDGECVEEMSSKGILMAEGAFRVILRTPLTNECDGISPTVIRAEIWSGWTRYKCKIHANDECIFEDE